MKKAVSVLMSLALAAGSFMCAPAFAAEQVTTDNVPSADYKFVDIANNGEGTLVAMAKAPAASSGDYSYVQLYYSLDNGETWNKNTSSLPDVYVNPVSTNKKSQQQLLWWDAQDTFVAHTTKGTFTSDDGQNWEKAGVSWSSAAMIAVQGDYLLHGANQKARAAAGTGAMTDSANPTYEIIKNGAYYVKALAAKPAADGKMEVLIAGPQFLHSYDLNTADLTWTENATTLNNGALPAETLDMIYAEGADQFLFVDGSGTLKTAAPKDGSINYIQFTVKDGVNVTGVNANDKYIAVGMSDGTMYYTANEQITRETVWTQVPEMQSDEAIKNIEFIDDTNFVALGDTKIYKGSLIPGEEPGGPEVSVPVLGETTTSGDGYFAKTGTFTLTPNGTAGINVKVTAGDQVQTKTIDAILETEVKLGIIIVSDDESKLESITPSVKITGADAE